MCRQYRPFQFVRLATKLYIMTVDYALVDTTLLPSRVWLQPLGVACSKKFFISICVLKPCLRLDPVHGYGTMMAVAVVSSVGMQYVLYRLPSSVSASQNTVKEFSLKYSTTLYEMQPCYMQRSF